MSVRLADLERVRICELSQKTLWEDEDTDVRDALDYLREKRNISDDVIKEYKFGYIPKRVRHAWSERIIMPLYDPYGDLVVLTSRKYKTQDKNQFPHLHEEFNKRQYLYGLDVSKENIIRKNKSIVVEGQFDTTRLRSNGIKTVVGVLGSAFSFEHAIILRRYCSEVFLVFDNDEAGIKTLKRSMEMFEEQDLESSFGMVFIPVVLPEGIKDPDQFIELRGAKEFCELLAESKIERKQFSLENI